MRPLKNWHPQLDPCCYPLLHPRGTEGFRCFMKKSAFKDYQYVPGSSEELERKMQEQLDKARATMDDAVNDLPYYDPYTSSIPNLQAQARAQQTDESANGPQDEEPVIVDEEIDIDQLSDDDQEDADPDTVFNVFI